MLLEHRPRVRIALQHFLGRFEPPREPVLRAALGHANYVGPELLALADGVTGQALALEVEFALRRVGFGRRGGRLQVVVLVPGPFPARVLRQIRNLVLMMWSTDMDRNAFAKAFIARCLPPVVIRPH